MCGVVRLARLLLIFFNIRISRCGFEFCHDEPGYDPAEGIAGDLEFSWLGTLQYIHIKRGTPEYFRVPRVVLVSRQYALCTARDAAQVSPGYALGNVIFEQYERDEVECGLSWQEIEAGKECSSGVLSAPIADVHIHPDYDQFKDNETLALLQLLTPVQSHYLLPICLPFRNNILTKKGTYLKWLYHIDYTSVTPRDMMVENRHILKINVLPRHKCHSNEYAEKGENASICTSACDFHSGAPSVLHEHTGHWTVVALAVGGPPCPDPLRPANAPPAPRHILVHPHIEWITRTITGMKQASFAKDDPFGFDLPRVLDFETHRFLPKYKHSGPGWLGHWWLSGHGCYSREAAADEMDNFYSERFNIFPDKQTPRNYFIEIFAPFDKVINCVKVGLPHQIFSPEASGISTTTVKLKVPIMNLKRQYKFQVEAWAVQKSATDKKSDDGEIAEKEK